MASSRNLVSTIGAQASTTKCFVHRLSSLSFHRVYLSHQNSTHLLWIILIVLYQVCVFQADRKNKMASDWLRHFRLLLLGEFKEAWQEARSQHPLPSFKTRWPPRPPIGWDIFDFSSETAERNSTKLDRKQDHNVLYLYPWPICQKSGTLYSGAQLVL